MSVSLPSYRYQPGIGNFGDASMGDEYVYFPTRLNDSLDISMYGYNSTLLNKSARYGSKTDPGDVEQRTSISYWGRRAWHGGADRNRFGVVPPKFTSTEEVYAYYQARFAEEDDLTNNWLYVTGNGAGVDNKMYQAAPRWNFTGSNKYVNVHPYFYPRLNGLYDTDLAGIETPLIQIGFVAQQAWLNLNNGMTAENHPYWNLYYNFSNAGSARFKAVNEAYFFSTSNPAAPNAAARAKIYERMWYQIYQNINRYKKNYLSDIRQADKFIWHDSKARRYFYARNKTAMLDGSNLGFAGDAISSNWNKADRRVESLDAWIYVSGSYNISTKQYSLDPDTLYFRVANAGTGSFSIARLPTDDSQAIAGVIYR